jgi:hypothetical protein
VSRFWVGTLVFVLLLGTGLTVLILVDDTPPRPEPPEPRPELLERPEAEQAPSEGEFTLRGWARHNQHDEEAPGRPLLYRFEATDSGPIEDGEKGAHWFSGVVITHFDPATGDVEAVLEAERATARVVPADGEDIGWRLDPAVRLETVAMRVVDESKPLAPLTMRMPELLGDLEQETFHTDSRVDVRGEGLELAGAGLVVDFATEQLVLPGDVGGRVLLESGRRHRLTSEGPLTLTDMGERVRLTAEREVELATNEGTLNADRIELFANEVAAAGPDGEGTLMPTTGSAQGSVLWEADQSRLEGNTAGITFDEEGEVADLVVEGRPRARLEPGAWDEDAPGDVEGEPILLSGAGPLLYRAVAGVFSMVGPAELLLGDARLTARDRISARLVEGEPPSLEARGDVRLSQAENTIETEALDAVEVRAQEAWRISSPGPAALRGRNESGDPIELDVQADLVAVLERERWALEHAEEADLRIGGERDIRVRAREVRELDVEAGQLHAVGEVRVDLEGRTLTGEEVRATARDHWELSGSPARYEHQGLVARADRIRRDGSLIQAAGDVRAHFEGEDLEVDVACADLEVLDLPPREGGDGSWSSELRADGAVNVWARFEEESIRVRCGRLEVDVDGTSTSPEERVWTVSRWRARDWVRATTVDERRRLELECKELDLTWLPDDVRFRGDLEARGDVYAQTFGETNAEAWGEKLTLQRNDSGRLEPAPGQRARAAGTLPGNDEPFDLSADWFEFSPEHLEAQNPDGSFAEIGSVGSVGKGTLGGELGSLRGRAGHLLATPGDVLLTGDVHLEGEGQRIENWSIDAQLIHLEGTVDEAAPESSEIGRLSAYEGVVLDFGVMGTLEGDEFVGNTFSAEMTMRGRPARLRRGGLLWESEWIEYNTAHHLPRSGPGRVMPENLTAIQIAAIAAGKERPPTLMVEYRSLETLVEPDRLVQALEEPIYRTIDREIRASWALLWLDRHRWEELGPTGLGDDSIEYADQETQYKLEFGISEQIFSRLKSTRLGSVTQEMYLEGPIEIYQGGELFMRSGALYLDAVSGHGWISAAEVFLRRSIQGVATEILVRAEWLRTAVDGSLHANDALITSCTFDRPHVYVKTQDLVISPIERDGEQRWAVSASRNRIHLYDTVTLPLPYIGSDFDDDARPSWKSVELGNSGRFGSLLGLEIDGEIGGRSSSPPTPAPQEPRTSGGVLVDDPAVSEVSGGYSGRYGASVGTERGGEFGARQQAPTDDTPTGRAPLPSERDAGPELAGPTLPPELEGQLGFEEEVPVQHEYAGPTPPPPPPPVRKSRWNDRFRLRYRLKAQWLGSRGLLLDGTIRLTPRKHSGESSMSSYEEDYWWYLSLGGLGDTGEDFGLERVPLDERNTLRLWARSRGRYKFSRGHWVEFAYTRQSDPGVQAEFWEGRYLEWEERVNDVHWRKSWGDQYAGVIAQVRSDDWRTEVERVPEAVYQHTPRQVVNLGSVQGLWSTQATAGYYRRVEGDPEYEAPFADGLGEGDSLRADNSHRLEFPVGTGLAGIKATPWAELRGTAWSNNVQETDSPWRAAALGGMRLSTVFWDPLSNGGVHELVPFAEFSKDLALERDGGVPLEYDRVENPIAGEIVRLGLRARWQKARGDELDLEIRGRHGKDTAPGTPEGWLPFGVFASGRGWIKETPVGFSHDAIYDFDDGFTEYSASTLAMQPRNDLTLESGFQQGKGLDGSRLFEAASFGARLRWTPKWELEGFQTVDLLGSGSLNSRFLLRRFGHDVVFEIEFFQRAGEGGPGFGFSFKPRLGWRPRDWGVILP